MKNVIKIIRVKSWIKNIFVFFPLVFSLNLLNTTKFELTVIACLVFSIAASIIYVCNDIIDIERDKLHPRKKNRPLPSGKITKFKAKIIVCFLVLLCLAGMSILNAQFALIVGVYLVLNFFYIFWFKHINIIESMLIPSNFVLRVLAGCSVINVIPSHWILVITFFVSLFLVFIKRRSELLLLDNQTEHRPVLKNYTEQTLWAYIIISATITVAAYILYTIDVAVISIFKTHNLLYTSIFVVIAIFRFIQLCNAERYSGEGDPTELLSKDRFLQIVGLLWIITVCVIIYL